MKPTFNIMLYVRHLFHDQSRAELIASAAHSSLVSRNLLWNNICLAPHLMP